MSNVKVYPTSRVRKDGFARIVFSVHYEGKRYRVYSHILVPVESWDSKTHRLKGRSNFQHRINRELDKISAELQEYVISSYMNPDDIVDQESLSSIIKPKDVLAKRHSFAEFVSDFLKDKSQTVSARTVQRYEAMFNHMKEFLGTSYKTSSVKQLNQRKFESFVRFMQERKKLQVVTVKKYVSYVVEFVKWLKAKDINMELDIDRIHLQPVEQIQFSLTWGEFDTMVKANLSNKPKLDRTRDLFCFAVYTGQRYSDVNELCPSDIIDGVWHLVSKKTKQPIRIPLVKPARELIDKYAGTEAGCVFPRISNQKVNRNLKELAQFLHLERPVKQHKQVARDADVVTKPLYEHISFHDARRTFVTLSRSKSMDVELVTSVTGHTNHKTYKRYHALETTTIRNALESVFEEQENESVFS